ncbi:hypothetical protein JL720_1345 [Aureococcus anophagefferens]|nr:hypothetical protein JL720_1345 [Aureococcus anophagefferens]
MKPTTRGPLTPRWARFLLGLSAFSVLPPLGPRVLVAGGSDASAAVAWGYVCVASACGLRVGALLRRGAAALPAWAAAPRWAAWAAVLAAPGAGRALTLRARAGASRRPSPRRSPAAAAAPTGRAAPTAGGWAAAAGAAAPLARARSTGWSPTRRRAPRLYVESCGGDRAAAEARWRKTVAWRRANDVAAVVRVGQPKYHDVKQMYPHHFGRAVGEIIMWELLGQLDTAVLRSGRVSMEEAFRHFIFIHEYAALKFEGEETELGRARRRGLRFSEVNSFLLRLVATASDVLNNLAPFRVRRIFILNAPSWFGAAWAGVRRVLPAETRHKVTIVGADYASTLAELADHDELPSTYGGGGPPLSQAEDELDMLEAACVLNSGGAVDFLERGSDSDASRRRRRRSARRRRRWDRRTRRRAAAVVGAVATPARRAPRRANDFYYCDQRRRWVLRGDEEDGAAPGGGDADEDALVVAIQAATPGEARAGAPRRAAAAATRESPSSTTTGDDAARIWATPLAVGLYLGLGLTWACQSFLFAAAPTWLLGPPLEGWAAADAAGAVAAARAGAPALALPEALARMPERRCGPTASPRRSASSSTPPRRPREEPRDDRLPRDSRPCTSPSR